LFHFHHIHKSKPNVTSAVTYKQR